MDICSCVPTGRSIAIERQPFHKLYAGFATPCLYPGLELLLLLVGIPVLCPAAEIGLTVYIFSGSYIVALLWAPALFNPRQFVLVRSLEQMSPP